MFDKFSDDSRTLLAIAREDALRLGHDYIAPEHLLLAVTQTKSGAIKVLKDLEVDIEGLRATVEAAAGTGDAPADLKALPFTPGAKHVLEHTVEETKRLGHHKTGTEHLLLGLLRGTGGAAKALQAANVDLEEARIRVRALRG